MTDRKRERCRSACNENPRSKRVCRTDTQYSQLSEPFKGCDDFSTYARKLTENTGNKKSINDLPTEALTNIFSYLTYEKRKIISLVCKRWRLICSDPLLNRYYTIGPSVPLFKVKQMLEEAPYLKHLRIAIRRDLPYILYTVLKYNTSVTNIKIDKCFRCRSNGFMQLSDHCPSLRSLVVNDVVISCREPLKNLSRGFETLQRLTIESPCRHRVGAATASSNVPLPALCLIELFNECKNLAHLKFSFPDVQSKFVSNNMVTSLSRFSFYQIVGLSLYSAELFDKAIEEISQCKNLRVLKLFSARQLTSRSMESLQTLSNLISLHLTNATKVDKSSWKSLVSQPWMVDLKSLNVSGCTRITNSILCEIGKNCKSLKHLNLSKCKLITGEGLMKILTGCDKLTYLNIKHTASRATSNCILVPQHMQSLRTLICENKHVHSSVRKELHYSCPKLTIDNL